MYIYKKNRFKINIDYLFNTDTTTQIKNDWDNFMSLIEKIEFMNVSLFNDRLDFNIGQLRNISFDVGFVDKIKEVSMVLLDAGWSDLGSWVSLSQLYREPDSSMTLFSKDAYVRQDKPWGYFKTLMESEVSKVKLLSVSPREKLSLQKHKRRKETWHIIKGSAKVTRDNEIFLMKIGESITKLAVIAELGSVILHNKDNGHKLRSKILIK